VLDSCPAETPQVRSGWLIGARHIASLNANQRPSPLLVDLLVIHNISLPPGEFGTGLVEALFCNSLDCSAHPWLERLRGVEVSAHLLIDRHGGITQFVPFHLRAWHAGASVFEGRENCNDFSIGIELEGTDELPYADEQYASLIAVTRILMREYPGISNQRIVGHADIAPGRKTDPGAAFDWQRYLRALA
jgi:N-acetyl-anhydromuramoyl-L-alanine amidase